MAVIGVPDPEWGSRVHAIVQLGPAPVPPTGDDLREHCRQRLAAHKVPKTFEFTDLLPRSAAGKLRRGALRANG